MGGIFVCKLVYFWFYILHVHFYFSIIVEKYWLSSIYKHCFFYCFFFSLFFPPFSLYHSIYFILFLSPSLEDSEARRNVLVHKLKEAQTTLELQTERLSKIENSARENNSLVEGLKFKEQVISLKIFIPPIFLLLRFRKAICLWHKVDIWSHNC